MKRREIYALVGGLALGLLVGLLLASAGIIPQRGTAVDVQTGYYLATLDDTSSWIVEEYAEDEDINSMIVDAFSEVESFDLFDIRQSLLNSKQAVDAVLVSVRSALVGEQIPDLSGIEAIADAEAAGPVEDKISVCLALDDDPYSLSDPVLYLYVIVPEDQTESLNIPDDWEKSDGLKSSDLFWLLLNCYAGEEE